MGTSISTETVNAEIPVCDIRNIPENSVFTGHMHKAAWHKLKEAGTRPHPRLRSGYLLWAIQGEHYLAKTIDE
ncbi:MAG: hypothetical protein Kow0075_08940 [Salibacteraceae bacterium]